MARIAYGTAWHVGSATRAIRDGFRQAGRLIAFVPSVVWRSPQTVRQHMGDVELGRQIAARHEHHSRSPDTILPVRQSIRPIVIEQTTRMEVSPEVATMAEFEERLSRMADTISALQQQIAEINTRRPVNGTMAPREPTEQESADPLPSGEQALLAGVFRRNVALQKRTRPERPAADINDES